jgi:hypothetical protein
MHRGIGSGGSEFDRTGANPPNVGQLQLAQLSSNGQSGEFGYRGLYSLTGPGRALRTGYFSL